MKNKPYAFKVFNFFFQQYLDDYKQVALDSLKYDKNLQNEIMQQFNTTSIDDQSIYLAKQYIKEDLVNKNFSDNEIECLLDDSSEKSDKLICKILYYQLSLIHDIDSADDIRAGLGNAGFDPYMFSKADWEFIYNMKTQLAFV